MNGAGDATRSAWPWLVVVAVVAVVGLGFAAVAAGWALAGDRASRTTSGVSAAPPEATPAVPAQPAPRPAPATQVRVPDVRNLDMVHARRRLGTAGLAVQLVFAADGTDRRVAYTDPPAGTTVRPGLVVHVYVRGAAPPTTVPYVVGVDCARAAVLMVERGLYVDHPTGRAGRVLRQDPSPGVRLRWNDRIRLHCGGMPAR